ncbi:uncharacterized protein LOC117040465 [Lacerta agilis]|uniref:uncharacterized protein LOC117040465 n=1 Tax=Lacerta agilis TaxID=80427 RepID=UPI001419D80F|nr:uncharacterized protein LOC117040465 [Lacerta agilis]
MKCALLLVLLLLLRLLPWGETQSTVPAPTEDPLLLKETNGPTCAQWLYGTEPPRVEAFQCVKQPDGAKVKFCCGTCDQTRNCSFEEVAEVAPARPTDGGPEPCPPSPRVLNGVKLMWFCAGLLVAAIFYWAIWGKGKRFFRGKTSAKQQGIELEDRSSVRSREHPGSSNASTRSATPSSAGAEGLPGPRGHPAAASSNAPSAQPQAGGSKHGRSIWDPREPVSLRIDPSPSQPNRGGKSPWAGPRGGGRGVQVALGVTSPGRDTVVWEREGSALPKQSAHYLTPSCRVVEWDEAGRLRRARRVPRPYGWITPPSPRPHRRFAPTLGMPPQVPEWHPLSQAGPEK